MFINLPQPPVEQGLMVSTLKDVGRAKQERRSLKYIRLAAHLAAQPAEVDRITLTLVEIEQIVGEELPANSRFPSWWRNDHKRMHSRAWLTAGWRVDSVGDNAQIEFVRNGRQAD